MKNFTDLEAAAAAAVAQRGINENVVIGPNITDGDGYLTTMYVGTHKRTAQKLTITSEDEIDIAKLTEILIKEKMVVHVFDGQREADRCALALWPATASIR